MLSTAQVASVVQSMCVKCSKDGASLASEALALGSSAHPSHCTERFGARLERPSGVEYLWQGERV